MKELKTFVVNDKGKPEASPGHHDDHVLACAIAVYNMDNATTFKIPKKKAISNRMLHKNPTMMCPDGFMRVPLNEMVRRRKRRNAIG